MSDSKHLLIVTLDARLKRSGMTRRNEVLRYNCCMSALLRVAHLQKSFDAAVINDVSFEVNEGEIVCLLGPSGCGKTTLLRVIAGLEIADAGDVIFDDHDMRDVPVHQRGFGFMFQDFALFPHKNVWDNVIFGLRMQNLPPDQIRQQAQAALTMVGLNGFEQRDVHQLSGGEKQRVALARSLAPQPRLLMLDEPLGALDRQLREELMIEVRRILKSARLTSIYVTHDQAEAFAVADRVAIMNAGRIEQIGMPVEVYARPASEFVARFLGLPNLIAGTVISCAANVAVIRTALGHLHVTTDRALKPNQTVTLLIRPDAATLDPNPFDANSEWFSETPQANVLEGELIDVAFRGRYQRVVVRVNDVDLVFEIETRSTPGAIGRRVRVALQSDALLIL
jgi:ABC-type Fe3+/spermidine/putrescine transport system ATPase subunit